MFKTLDKVCTPRKGSKYSACVDLYARIDVEIQAGETKLIPLGVCLDKGKFPIYVQNNLKQFYLQLEPRSSLRVKGLMAGTGIIDIDYENEIMILLSNPFISDSIKISENTYQDAVKLKNTFKINKGDKIAQIMLCEHKSYLLGVDTKDERTGGFGSTGK